MNLDRGSVRLTFIVARFRFPRASRPEVECEHVRGLMSDYVDGELEPPEHERVERHVAFCPRCHTVLANLRRTLAVLGSLGSSPAAGADAATEAAKRAWRDRIG